MSTFTRCGGLLRSVLVLPLLAGWVLAGGMVGGCGEPVAPSVTVLSSPPDRVSGGDARVAITTSAPADREEIEVYAGDRAVTDLFSPVEPGRWEGVIRGLPIGETELRVEGPGGTRRLELVNHPRSGPMFSGPPQKPFVCSRPAHRRRAWLGPPRGANCRMDTRVSYLCRSTETGTFEPVEREGPDSAWARPKDLARTVTAAGDTVDYVVRWE